MGTLTTDGTTEPQGGGEVEQPKVGPKGEMSGSERVKWAQPGGWAAAR